MDFDQKPEIEEEDNRSNLLSNHNQIINPSLISSVGTQEDIEKAKKK